jgi:hypothetical protein
MKMDLNGFVVSPKTFCLGSVVFYARKEKIVLHLSPHIAVNADDEKSCYAVLLLHTVWPNGDEDSILGSPPVNAVQQLASLRSTNMLPSYVDCFLEKVTHSETIMSVQESPQSGYELNEEMADDLVEDVRPDLRLEGNDDDCEDDEDDGDDISRSVNGTDVLEEMHAARHEGLHQNVPKRRMIFLRNYISEQQRKFMDNYLLENQLQCDEAAHMPDVRFNNPKWISFNDKLQRLGGKQRAAFDIVTSYVSGSRIGQLMMFMSGEGGTGKSEVIKFVMEYTRLLFGKTAGLYGSVVAIGPTGVASNNINGFTWQSVCKMSRASNKTKATLDNKITMGRNIEGVQLVIIDEVSMISCDAFYTISSRFRDARLTTIRDIEERKRLEDFPFGGIHVLCVGDFYQLPPIGRTGLYDPLPKTPEGKAGRNLWCSIRHYVELDMNYRLVDSDEGTRLLASCLKDLRKGYATTQNLAILNSRCLRSNEKILLTQTHPKSVWLSCTNDRVDHFNDQAFYNTVKGDAVFKYRCIAKYVPNLGNEFPTTDEIGFLHSQPSSVKEKHACFATYLDIAIGSRVRCLKNKGTQIGVFNGAIGSVVGFCFEGVISTIPVPLVKDFPNHSDREIPIVLVEMDQLSNCATKILPFAAEVDEDHPMKTNGKVFFRMQLPLELAYASTVHKYQGLTAQYDVIVDPARSPFAMGLEYVAISRTKSLDRLHIIRPLEERHFNSKRFKKDLQLVRDEYSRLEMLDQICGQVDDYRMV